MDLKPTPEDLARGFTGHLAGRDNVVLDPGNRDTKRGRSIIAPETHEILYRGFGAVRERYDIDPLACLDDEIQDLPGRYVFGGYLRIHFGHFLVECISPLWALDHFDGPCDGIVFFPFHANPSESERNRDRLRDKTRVWLEALGVDAPFHILREPTRVDHLLVGENGFGFADRFRGSSFFHQFMRSRNARIGGEQPSGNRRKLYLSRRKLGPRKGQIIGEEQLERTLVEAGYEAYVPEADPLDAQLETYRQAEKIIGVEGSALHVPPFCCPSDCAVGIISRRSQSDQISAEFGEQYRGFAEIEPLISCEIQAFWTLPGMRRPGQESIAVIDFDKTYETLIKGGFLSPDDRLYTPGPMDLVEHIERASMGHQKHLHLFDLERRLKDIPQ